HARYMWQIASGDLGPSCHYRDWTVNDLIAQGAPVSFTLGAIALILALIIGVIVGAWAALRQNRPTDYGMMSIAMIGISIPNFVMAPLLILLFAIVLACLRVGVWAFSFERMVLPVTPLALPIIAYAARITRGSTIDVLHSSYIRTVRAKGMPEKGVLLRHALKPALLPVISYLGPA